MSKDNVGEQFIQELKNIEGFSKITSKNNDTKLSSNSKISTTERVKLIRIANQLFNEGEIEKSKRIFTHISYTDGLTRIGDYYYKSHQFLEAMHMYQLAKDQKRFDEITEHVLNIIKKWINSNKDQRT